jgi:hypothetical protein
VLDQESAAGRGQVVLMRVWDNGEAILIRQLLESYGIPCRTASGIPHTVWPIAIDGLGETRIMVPAELADEAQCLLAEHRRQGLRLIRGGRSKRPRITPGAAEASGSA